MKMPKIEGEYISLTGEEKKIITRLLAEEYYRLELLGEEIYSSADVGKSARSTASRKLAVVNSILNKLGK